MSGRTIVIGAGLAGLTCARALDERGVDCVVIEAADDVGGRVRTDVVDGLPMDRGFQVLLTAYPEARRWLDYPSLEPRAFYAGALTRCAGEFKRVADPTRRPLDGLASLVHPVGTFLDKLRMARLRARLSLRSVERNFLRPEVSTATKLTNLGFSEDFLRGFLSPFFRGVFLDPDLLTTSRMFEFTFQMFSSGPVVVPAAGMGAIPRQLAAGLPHDSLRLGTAARALDATSVTTWDGERIEADAVVVATDAKAAAVLTGAPPPLPGRSVVCLYFRAPQPPVDPFTLVLDGDGGGPINNLCVRDAIDGRPESGWLVSATVLPPYPSSELDTLAAVRAQLSGWFGDVVQGWDYLRSYEVRDALPDQGVGVLDFGRTPARLESGVYVCGDYRHSGSIQGAMTSGRQAAEAVLTTLGI